MPSTIDHSTSEYPYSLSSHSIDRNGWGENHNRSSQPASALHRALQKKNGTRRSGSGERHLFLGDIKDMRAVREALGHTQVLRAPGSINSGARRAIGKDIDRLDDLIAEVGMAISRQKRDARMELTEARMRIELEPVLEFTKTCRFDMHEPDEQGITAHVEGTNLDNAFGIAPETGELVIVLQKEGARNLRINLATLIALARTSRFAEGGGRG